MNLKIVVVMGIVATLGTTVTAVSATSDEVDSVSASEAGPVAAHPGDADSGCRSDYEDDLRHANAHYQERLGEAQNLEDVGGATGHFGDEVLGGTDQFVSCVVE